MEFTPKYENFLEFCLDDNIAFFNKNTLKRYTACVTCNIIKNENKHFEELWLKQSKENDKGEKVIPKSFSKLFIYELLVQKGIEEQKPIEEFAL